MERVPEATFSVLENGQVAQLATSDIFKGKTIVAFAVPGAFTPTCSTQHLPRFEELAPAFRRLGVHDVCCIAVNDPYVLAYWAEQQRSREVRMLADPTGAFTRALGMMSDRQAEVLGPRSRRYALVVEDGRIERMFAEPDEDGDPFTVSDADTVYRYVAGAERAPSRIAIVTKAHCPHSAKAKGLLDERGLRYCEVELADADCGRFLSATSGTASAPRVFINGTCIGGCEDLQRFLQATV